VDKAAVVNIQEIRKFHIDLVFAIIHFSRQVYGCRLYSSQLGGDIRHGASVPSKQRAAIGGVRARSAAPA
jgi:hypothetical protein